MPDKLFLIDGHALIFKMYYAFLKRPMVNSKGVDTSILFGFVKYIFELIGREAPTHIAVAFDPPGGTFRNEIFPLYKANRAETPQLVIDALEPLMRICKSLNIRTLMMPGYEADDVIGTVAKKFASENVNVYMVTPDKDYGQLIDEHIFQYKPGRNGGEDEIIGVREICEKYGIESPLQVVEMLTLCGDAADNVPGVKGIGEVGAGKLISKYGSVSGIYSHISELTPRQQSQLSDAEDHIALSHKLVTIKTDVPVEVDYSSMALDRNFGAEAFALFEEYEFNSLRKMLGKPVAKPDSVSSAEVNAQEDGAGCPDDGQAVGRKAEPRIVVTRLEAWEMCRQAGKAGEMSLIVETESPGIFSRIKRIVAGVAVRDEYYASQGGVEEFRAVLSDPKIAKVGYNLKFLRNVLGVSGVELKGRICDIELMHYILDPEKSHKAEVLAKSYLGVDINPEEEPVMESAQEELSLFDMAAETSSDSEKLSDRSVEAAVLPELYHKVWDGMDETQRSLYEEMEEPLSEVLAGMEKTGVKVDREQLDIYADTLREETKALEAEIRSLAGEPAMNVSSPKQVGEVLFDKLRLNPKAKKGARGSYSTDEATLSELAGRHPIVEKILDYRGVKKLLSTYIEPLPSYISSLTGKIHTTFNQALTATGRLSSSNPNLQNIPIRTERGKEIRKAFVPGTDGGRIVSADYSQIELRIMAHLSQDEHLLNAFREGIDIHAATAAKIFRIPHDQVRPEQRRIAKTANFGIMYGISAFGLSQRLGVSRSESKKLIEDYFAAFPAIRTFIDDTLTKARETGYVETLFGRRRYIPNINAGNANIRALAERNAVNAPIQGTSADIIKMAMILVDRKLSEQGFESRMVLQIHDELVFDAVRDEVDALMEMVKKQMEHTVELSVPLTVECNYGENWLEAH